MELRDQLTPQLLKLQVKDHNTHRTGGCVGLRVGLDALQRTISCLCWEMNPGQSSPQPNHYTN